MMIFDTDAQDAKIATMRGELSDLKHELLLLEMQLVDQLEVKQMGVSSTAMIVSAVLLGSR